MYFLTSPGSDTCSSLLYAHAAARNTYRVPPGDPACPACPGSLVAPQVLVPPWLLRCPGDLEALVGRAGSDWSGNHLESDSASD